MKKILYVLIMLFAFVFVGCSENQPVDLSEQNNKIIALEEALDAITDEIGNFNTTISDLEQQIADYEFEIEMLLEQIAELEAEDENYNGMITALRKMVVEAQDKLKALTNDVEALDNSVKVQLADEYYLVVGDNFQLFYQSIIQAADPYGYYIKIEGKNGHAYNRYYEFKPEKTGTYDLKISVCNNNGVVLGSDSTKLIVSENTVNATDNVKKTILCFGDSLTYDGTWVSHGLGKYIAAGYTNIKTIGASSKTVGSNVFYYEGRSGWQWSNYYGKYEDVLSPFASTTSSSQISFKDYAKKYNVSQIDELYILLTWNGIGGKFREFDLNDSFMSPAKKIIDTYHKEYPNGKVTLIGIPKPSTHAGLGAYYEIGISNGDNYAQSVTVMNYNQTLENWCKMEEYSSFMRYVDGMGQFDSEYNMPSTGKPVNNQNTTTEPVGTSMGLHPTTNGYRQIGDAFFRALMKEW